VAKVTMPQLGESVAEGTIGKWLKQPGDRVERDEPLLEIITDKVNAEVPSPFAGILTEILVAEGQTVPFNVELAVIEEAAGAEAAPRGAGTAAAAAATPAAVAPDQAAPPAAPQAAPSVAAETTVYAPALVPVMDNGERPGNPDARMTPAVRKLLRDNGLSAEQIVGTGHDGRLTREDVMAYVEMHRNGGGAAGRESAAPAVQAASSPAPSAAPRAGLPTPAQAPAPSAPSTPSGPSPIAWPEGQDEELIPLNQMRRGIAAQMTRAAAVPTAYSTFECDMTAVANLRAAQGASYKAREGVSLSYLPFVVKAVVEGLKGNPNLNATYSDAGLLRKRRINIGIAIAVENGLIVPVIHDADQLSLNGINRAIQDLAGRARANKLRLDDLQGGSFTVDNTGWFGSILTVPILNVPEVCILTTEAVVKRPIVRETDDGAVIAVRSMMNMVAGYDHRATDGAQVGKFMQDVICWLEATGPDTSIY
jgi:pyruvate/2-oxoglutarate dehydrogenase complex dihydrolipoamide acyltransferase (E2) component